MSLDPIDPRSSALLLMDFQNDILANNLSPEQSAAVLDHAQTLLAAARGKGMPVIHVVVCFRPGHPEVAASNRLFSRIKAANMLVAGTDGAAIHPRLQPTGSEPVVSKRRVGAFAETDMQPLLRAMGVQTLVLGGVATSGVVLSTVRQAFDHDFRLVVAADCCADADAEVHRVLLEKVLARQADVVDTAEVVAALQAA